MYCNYYNAYKSLRWGFFKSEINKGLSTVFKNWLNRFKVAIFYGIYRMTIYFQLGELHGTKQKQNDISKQY